MYRNDLAMLTCLFSIFYIVSNIKVDKENMSGGGLLNVYDQELQDCPDDDYESNGSWDENKKCSELDGGVHQICYRDIGSNSNKFSEKTGQSDWSTDRNEQNHCVCLGAWSLYKARLDNEEFDDNSVLRLKCDAIPKVSMSKEYVNKFSTWNGNELPDQIINGVEGLVSECENDANNDSDKINNLRNNYCSFANNVNTLKFKKNDDGKLTQDLKSFYKDRCDN